MSISASELIETTSDQLLSLDRDLWPVYSDWKLSIGTNLGDLDPITKQAYLISEKEQVEQSENTPLSGFSGALTHFFNYPPFDGPQIHEDGYLSEATEKVIEAHFPLSDSATEIAEPFLSLVTERRIKEMKLEHIDSLLRYNKDAFHEARLANLEKPGSAESKTSQRERGKGKRGYTDRRQALLLYYMLTALGVKASILDKTELARLLHLMSGSAPDLKNEKEDLNGSSLYQAVKKQFSASEKRQAQDLEFIASILRPLATLHAEGVQETLRMIEKDLADISDVPRKPR